MVLSQSRESKTRFQVLSQCPAYKPSPGRSSRLHAVDQFKTDTPIIAPHSKLETRKD